MFEDLPKSLQEEVLEHLQKNDFPAAKALYDAYHDEHPKSHPKTNNSPTQSPQNATASQHS